jgi:hypothetical protein
MSRPSKRRPDPTSAPCLPGSPEGEGSAPPQSEDVAHSAAASIITHLYLGILSRLEDGVLSREEALAQLQRVQDFTRSGDLPSGEPLAETDEYSYSRVPTEERAHRREKETRGDIHRHKLEFASFLGLGGLALFVVVLCSVVAAIAILANRDADSVRAAWDLVKVLVGIAVGGFVGYCARALTGTK